MYELRAGSDDPQKPHTEDELYVVLRGRAKATVDGDTATVSPGDLLYVAAGRPHCFHEIEEDLVVLVVFAPAEGTAARGPASIGKAPLTS